MKNQILVLCILLLSSTMMHAQQTNDVDLIIKSVHQFSQAADAQNVELLNQVLDVQYRAAVNRAFGSKELMIIDKSTYLQMAKDKKIGGDKRSITIKSIDVEGNLAQVKAELLGSELKFTTFISLVKTENGSWVIIQDMPEIISNK